MIFGTIISGVLAFILFVYPAPQPATLQWAGISFILIFIPFTLFCLSLYLQSAAWIPLQNEEKNYTPRVSDLFRKDPLLKVIRYSMEILPVIAIFLGLLIFFYEGNAKLKILCGWLILLGVMVDLVRFLSTRMQNYLNPYAVITLMAHAANRSIQNEKQTELCDWIEAIAEIALKAVPRFSTSLANEAIEELQTISKNFLNSSKSLTHSAQGAQRLLAGENDRISYILFYLFQRLDLINEKAIHHGLEPVSSCIVVALGKITLNAAKCDISLFSYPIHYVGKCAIRAMQNKLPDVGVKASLTLYQVGQSLLDEIDPTYLEIKEGYLSLITQMHAIAQETFKQDKSVRLDLLMQPFRDLKERFKSKKMINHPDTPDIINKIDSVLGEFDALELVLRTIPPIPQYPEEPPASNP